MYLALIARMRLLHASDLVIITFPFSAKTHALLPFVQQLKLSDRTRIIRIRRIP
jgi:hypothetical protein